ncbi:MAG: histidine kinase [Bacteroidota bacterium]
MFKTNKRYLFILLLGVYSFLNIKFTEGDSLISIPGNDVTFFFLILLLVFLLWEGNHFFENFITKKTHQKIATRLVKQFVFSMLIVVLLSLLTSTTLLFLVNKSFDPILLKLLLGFTFRVNLFLHCINAITTYNKELSSSKLEAEKLKQETTEAQFEALRNQINPHFLFNSFNVLSSLVESEPKVAVQFIEQLSIVYRYLLKTKELKVISLKEELEFLRSYIFLLHMRFQNNLDIHLEINEEEHKFLPPATLQLLIENAIKHNEVSKRFPLVIDLFQTNGSLVVKNNLNPKSFPEESSLVGLNNIKSRYLLLGGTPPIIEKTREDFKVTIPLIHR